MGLRSSSDLERYCVEVSSDSTVCSGSSIGTGEEESVENYTWSSSLSSFTALEDAGLGAAEDEVGFLHAQDEDAAFSHLIDRMVEVALTHGEYSCSHPFRDL